MRIPKKLIIGILLSLNIQLPASAQIWPFSPIVRFGNTIYYPIDSLITYKQRSKNLTLDKKIENRFVDPIILHDSIGIKICDTIVFFNQKPIKEPYSYKKILFYKRNCLYNSNLSIKYIKILGCSDKELHAQATFFRNKTTKFKKNEQIVINIEDIKGIFVGPGKEYRNLLSTMGVVAAIGGCILIL